MFQNIIVVVVDALFIHFYIAHPPPTLFFFSLFLSLSLSLSLSLIEVYKQELLCVRKLDCLRSAS